jgi:hypothetical protein
LSLKRGSSRVGASTGRLGLSCVQGGRYRQTKGIKGIEAWGQVRGSAATCATDNFV